MLALIFQSSTLLYRGQSLRECPKPWSHAIFYLVSMTVVILHIIFLMIRANMRFEGFQKYSNMSGVIYIMLPVCAIFSSLVTYILNKHDLNFYRRYLNFLRLEFDTRLGMHSPRWFYFIFIFPACLYYDDINIYICLLILT